MDMSGVQPDESTQLIARLERIPFTRYQILFVIAMAIGLFFDQYDLGTIGPVLPVIEKEFALSPLLGTTVVAAGFVGMLIGASLSGYLADRLGRRRLFVYTLLIIAVGAVLNGASMNFTELTLTRAITGFGIGGDIPIVWAYLSELVPARSRGKWFGVAVPIGLLGFPASAFAASYFVQLGPDGWRYVFYIAGVIALVVWPLREVSPESPRYYLSRGQIERARETLEALEKKVQRAYGRPLPPPDLSKVSAVNPVKSSYLELFSKRFRATTVQIILIQIFQTIAYYGVTSFLPLILIAKGFSLVRAIEYTALTFLGQIVGAGLLMGIGDILQRRYLMAIGSLVAAVFGLAFAFSSTAAEVLIFGFMLNVGSQLFYAGMAAYTPEIFPARLRGTGSGLSYAFGRGFNIAGLFVIGVALAGMPTAQLSLVALFYIFILILSVTMGYSTSKRSLEELTEAAK